MNTLNKTLENLANRLPPTWSIHLNISEGEVWFLAENIENKDDDVEMSVDLSRPIEDQLIEFLKSINL